MTEETAVIQKPYRKASAWHSPNEEGKPQCNVPIGGDWVVIPVEELPSKFDRCKKCSGEFNPANSLEDGEVSLLKQAMDGSPEDFGLSEIPGK